MHAPDCAHRRGKHEAHARSIYVTDLRYQLLLVGETFSIPLNGDLTAEVKEHSFSSSNTELFRIPRAVCNDELRAAAFENMPCLQQRCFKLNQTLLSQ